MKSAKALQHRCDAVDINFGCPQDIARRGKYGAWLCDDWDLIYNLSTLVTRKQDRLIYSRLLEVNVLHVNLDIPVTAKFRIFSDVEKTIKYAKMMESAGAQILTCHGRTREQRGHNSVSHHLSDDFDRSNLCLSKGLADWAQIAAVKKAVSVPVFANGSVLYPDDVQKCLDFTGADAYMSAEPQLHNPAIFMHPPGVAQSPLTPEQPTQYPIGVDLALEYLDIVASLKTPTTPSAVKAHLFKLMHHALPREIDLRNQLGTASMRKDGVGVYVDICKEMKMRMEVRIARGVNFTYAHALWDSISEISKRQGGIPHLQTRTTFLLIPPRA